MLARLRHAASTALPRLLHEQGGALAALQQRAASSHSENTNTFLREVSTAGLNITCVAPCHAHNIRGVAQPALCDNIGPPAHVFLALPSYGAESAPREQAAFRSCSQLILCLIKG